METAGQLAAMLRSSPVEMWQQEIADLDTPDYMMTFAGLVTTLLTLQLPPDQVDTLIDVLAGAFSLPEDMKQFLVEDYLPEVGTMYIVELQANICKDYAKFSKHEEGLSP